MTRKPWHTYRSTKFTKSPTSGADDFSKSLLMSQISRLRKLLCA